MAEPDVLHSTRYLTTPEVAQVLGVNCAPSILVTIDEAALSRTAHFLQENRNQKAYHRYTWDNPLYWLSEGSPAERSQYLTIGNAVNFRFWSLTQGQVHSACGIIEGTTLSGSLYMWRCLRRCLDSGRFPLLDASFLASISQEEFTTIFTDDNGENPLEIALSERLANWHDLGRRLRHDWAGQFHNVLEAASGSLINFVRLSQAFRAFEDPLFKLTMVNVILHLGNGITRFDAEPLPGIDYHIVKQLLRQGVLVPNASLRKKLERQIVLTPTEAHELRRTALCALIELSARTGLSGEILDNQWWGNRVHCRTYNPVCHVAATAHECQFFGYCAQLTNLRLPLEETRYY